VPQAYRQVDKTDLAIDEKAARQSKGAKNGKKQKQMSLVEINERAADRIQEIQRANALKSQQKIKQLAVEHMKKKGMPVDPDTIMDNDSEGEESKQERPKGGAPRHKRKGKNGNRTPLEKKEKVPSKNTVVASKMANKRQQKEAIKKNKIKRNKGTIKPEGESRPNGKEAN